MGEGQDISGASCKREQLWWLKEITRLTISLSSLSDSRIMGCFFGLPGPLRFFPWSGRRDRDALSKTVSFT